jgi:8-amino-7-oxononanoate synthase
MPFTTLRAELDELEAEGLARRRLVLESPQGPRVLVGGREYLAFCSNDYLGLANHPELIAAIRAGAERYGAGASASHLITGHHAEHHALEKELAEFLGAPRTLFFSTGYMANLGVVSALADRNAEVFADRLNHASLNDAAIISRARLVRYPHLDLAALDKRLAKSGAKRRLVITDAVFSMDGDLAPLPDLAQLCERRDAWLLVDDAHGFGVLGEDGRGSLSHFRLRSPRIIYMGTLGKAAGVFGAFVAGETDVVEYLSQRARTYVYTTATPPFIAHALRRSLGIIRGEGWRRQRLRELVSQLKEALSGLSWKLLPSATPIQPLLTGDSREAVRVTEALRERGMLVPAIRPPTVPRGAARLRISLSAAHAPQDLEALASALREIA